MRAKLIEDGGFIAVGTVMLGYSVYNLSSINDRKDWWIRRDIEHLEKDARFYAATGEQLLKDTYVRRVYELQAWRAREQIELRKAWLEKTWWERFWNDAPSMYEATVYIDRAGYDLSQSHPELLTRGSQIQS